MIQCGEEDEQTIKSIDKQLKALQTESKSGALRLDSLFFKQPRQRRQTARESQEMNVEMHQSMSETALKALDDKLMFQWVQVQKRQKSLQ